MDLFTMILAGMVIPAMCLIASLAFLFPIVHLGFDLTGYKIDSSARSYALYTLALSSVSFLEVSVLRLLYITLFVPLWNR